jgi:hypothetical protein
MQRRPDRAALAFRVMGYDRTAKPNACVSALGLSGLVR